MAHPYASQAKASQKRRLSALGAKAGKSFGSSSMYKKTSYPSKNAGTSRELTISGGSAKKRADRPANHFAGGGLVGGGGGFGGGSKKKKGRGGSTTNIIIASPGGGAGAQPPRAMPVPVPVNRPVPVPVGAGAPPIPPRPAGLPPGAGGPPVNVNVPPPAAAPPMPGPRPPGMASGGSVYHNWGKGFKDGGHVKKKARGGLIEGTEGPYTAGSKTVKDLSRFHPAHDFDPGTGMGSIGPKSDEAQTDEVGAERRMRDMRSGRDLRDNDWSPKEPGYPKREDRRFKGGGAIKKKANGGGLGPGGIAGPGLTPRPRPFAPGAVPGTPGARPGSPGRGSPVVPLTGGRPTRPGYKDGGHADEAEDKKLIRKMMKKKAGGRVGYHEDGDEVEPQASSTSVPAPPGATSGASSSGGMKKIMDSLGGVAKALGGPGSSSSSSGVSSADAAARAADTSRAVTAQGNTPKNIQYAGFKPAAIPGGSKRFNFTKGGAVKKADGGDVPLPKPDPRYRVEDAPDLEPGIAKKWNEQMGRIRSIERGDKQPWDKSPGPGLSGSRYNKGGAVKAGGATGLGRLAKISGARKVPPKTEI